MYISFLLRCFGVDEELIKLNIYSNDAVYTFDDVYEIGSFVAQPSEAYMLDVRIPHNVEPLGETAGLRKAFALRTRYYDYAQVYEMLKETGNL